MKRFVVTHSLLALLTLAGCQRFSVEDSIAPGPIGPLVQKGSGGTCAPISGDYGCSLTEQERLEGMTEYTLTLEQKKNATGKEVLSLGEVEFITDGGIHNYSAKDGVTVTYSVDCRPTTTIVHAVGSDGNEIKAEFKKASETELAFNLVSNKKGSAKAENRVCKSK